MLAYNHGINSQRPAMNFNNLYKFKIIDNKNIEIFKTLKKKIKKDNNNYGCSVRKRMRENEKIICFIDERTNKFASFIWFEIYSGNKINLNKIDKIAHVNFSYTFCEFRKLGLNTKLRKWIEKFCFENKINYVVSVPLPNSNSENILNKLGYEKQNSHYCKKIF